MHYNFEKNTTHITCACSHFACLSIAIYEKTHDLQSKEPLIRSQVCGFICSYLLTPVHCRATASHQTYFEEIRQLFFRDEYSLLAEKWNAQRAQAVAHALLKVLYPLMEKELRAKLLTEAKEHVLQVSV